MYYLNQDKRIPRKKKKQLKKVCTIVKLDEAFFVGFGDYINNIGVSKDNATSSMLDEYIQLYG